MTISTLRFRTDQIVPCEDSRSPEYLFEEGRCFSVAGIVRGCQILKQMGDWLAVCLISIDYCSKVCLLFSGTYVARWCCVAGRRYGIQQCKTCTFLSLLENVLPLLYWEEI